MRHTSVLPQSHNHRKQQKDERMIKKVTLPVLSFVKSTNLSNLFMHSLILYTSIWKPEVVLTYLFNDDSNEKNKTIIAFYGFFQALPIFISIQSFMQIDSNKAKQLCLPLAFSDAATILAIKHIKVDEEWTVSVILITIFLGAQIFSNLISFLLI